MPKEKDKKINIHNFSMSTDSKYEEMLDYRDLEVELYRLACEAYLPKVKDKDIQAFIGLPTEEELLEEEARKIKEDLEDRRFKYKDKI